MKTPIKIGIAGAKFAARFHMDSYRKIGGVAVEVVGVYSKSAESRRAFANILYNPVEKQLEHVYLNEKLGTKQGWSFPAPDEDWMTGYPQEIQDFIKCLRDDREPQSNVMLAADTVSTLYAAYIAAQDQGRVADIPLID